MFLYCFLIILLCLQVVAAWWFCHTIIIQCLGKNRVIELCGVMYSGWYVSEGYMRVYRTFFLLFPAILTVSASGRCLLGSFTTILIVCLGRDRVVASCVVRYSDCYVSESYMREDRTW